MNIVFFGTSEFAVPSLERLAKSRHKILAVVTQPDRKKGRFQKLTQPAVKEAALKLGLPVFQPPDLNDSEIIERLKAFKADLFVVVSYGNILKKNILEIPLKFCVNLHGSLLPKYRGAAPVNWAIINGDELTGASVIKMNEKMDEGDIILNKEVPILTPDTAQSLSMRLAYEGSQVLVQALDLIDSGKASLQKQDNAKASYAPKLKKEDGIINWNKTALEIISHIRGMQPWPGAYTYLAGKLIKVCKASIYGTTLSAEPGKVLAMEKDGLLVGTGLGAIVLEELQPESSRRMDINAFLAGHKLKAGDVFTCGKKSL